MTYRVIYSPDAKAQLNSILVFIAQNAGPEIAKRFVDAIVSYCDSFSLFPRRGTLRKDLRPGLRTIGFRKRATIAFTVSGQSVTIVGIFYGGQDVSDALSDDEVR